jgi:ABC-type multidrug transport system ATPase subunit
MSNANAVPDSGTHEGGLANREPSPLLIRNLTFSYPGTTVFSEFSLVAEDRVVVFRGPSGCGKSTLLKLISRNLEPSHCSQLAVPFDSLMLVQEDALAPWLTGLQNITRFTRIDSTSVLQHPAYKHVEPFIGRPAFTMSYGQRRLVELVRATLLAPPLLCLDEPFNFLDPVSRSILTEVLLDRSVIPSDTRIVISSHYNEEFSGAGVGQFVFDGHLPVRSLRPFP